MDQKKSGQFGQVDQGVEGRCAVGPLSELVFRLSWSTRDKIIMSLSQHSQMLLGKTLKGPERSNVKKNTLELTAVLFDLPLQTLKRASCEVILELDAATRGRIINGLSLNHSLALLHADTVTSEMKTIMLKQNRELIDDLWNLPVQAADAQADDDRPAKEDGSSEDDSSADDESEDDESEDDDSESADKKRRLDSLKASLIEMNSAIKARMRQLKPDYPI